MVENSSLLERATLPKRLAIYQKLKEKHNTQKLNLTIERNHKKRRRRYTHVEVTPPVRRPRLHFRKYDQLESMNYSQKQQKKVWQPRQYSRLWTEQYVPQHKWKRVPETVIEMNYAPVEVGYGYNTLFTSRTFYNWTATETVTLSQSSDKERSDISKLSELWIIPKSKVDLRDFPQCQLGYFKDNGFISQQRHVMPKCMVCMTAICCHNGNLIYTIYLPPL